jgi:hypothetical protein
MKNYIVLVITLLLGSYYSTANNNFPEVTAEPSTIIEVSATVTIDYNGCTITAEVSGEYDTETGEIHICDAEISIRCSYIKVKGNVVNPNAESAELIEYNYNFVEGERDLIERKELLPGIKQAIFKGIQEMKNNN